MPILVDWANETHDIIIIRYFERYTWTELDRTIEAVYSMMESVEHWVAIISIIGEDVQTPEGNVFQKMMDIMSRMPNNLKVYIMIGRGNPLTRSLINLFFKFYPSPYPILYMNNLTEALTFLNVPQDSAPIR